MDALFQSITIVRSAPMPEVYILPARSWSHPLLPGPFSARTSGAPSLSGRLVAHNLRRAESNRVGHVRETLSVHCPKLAPYRDPVPGVVFERCLDLYTAPGLPSKDINLRI